MVVDSIQAAHEQPVALRYLDGLGIDPARSVRVIVATHWHDDHTRGLSELVARCPKARSCCANVLSSREFLSAAAGLMDQQSGDAIGVREIYLLMDHLRRAGTQPDWATASRRISYELGCEVWSLSPDDHAYTSFLKTLADVTRSRRGTAVPWPLPTPIPAQNHRPTRPPRGPNLPARPRARCSVSGRQAPALGASSLARLQ